MKGGILLAAAAAAVIGWAGFSFAAASRAPIQATKNEQAEKAKQAANSIVFRENAEIENIKRRLELTSDPGAMGFIILLNESGQPIMYEGVRGKVTSGSKRLTDAVSIRRFDQGGSFADTYLTVPAPSDEGTHGSSGEYIFYWNTNGEYRQWNGKYLYSDKPFRLSVQPLVITVETERK